MAKNAQIYTIHFKWNEKSRNKIKSRIKFKYANAGKAANPASFQQISSFGD